MGLAREFALAVKAENPALVDVASSVFRKRYGYDIHVTANTRRIQIMADSTSWDDLDAAVLQEPKRVCERYAAMAAHYLEVE